MRRRAVQFLTFILAAATGVGLLGAAAVVTEAPAGGGAEVANIALARSYYGAIADVLRTGDPAALEALVAPHFVDHGAAAAAGSSREELKRYLAGLRTTFPDLSLTVVDLLADGDRVTARLSATGTPRADFAGIPLPARPVSWELLEVLRISDGEVVERWGGRDAVRRFQPLLQATFDRLPASPVIALARITYAPGADLRAPRLPALPGPGLVLVEAGTLTLAGNGLATVGRGTPPYPDQVEVTSPGVDSKLHPGDVAVFPTRASSLRNDGSTPAAVLAVAFFPPAGDGRWALSRPNNDGPSHAEALAMAMFPPTNEEPVDLPPGITVEPLVAGALNRGAVEVIPTAARGANGPRSLRQPFQGSVGSPDLQAGLSDLPAGPVEVAVGRATIVPGEQLPPHGVAGAEVLAVEAGTLGVSSGGSGLHIDGTSQPGLQIESERGPGSGLVVPQCERSSIRNAGAVPVTFVLAMVTPTSP